MRGQDQANHFEPGRSPAPSQTGLGDFAWRTVVALLLALLFFTLAYLLGRGIHVVLQAFAGVLFAVFLTTVAQPLSKRTGLPYGLSLTAVVVVLLLAVGGGGWLLANHLAVQIEELSQRLPDSLEQVRAFLGRSDWGRMLLQHAPSTEHALAGLAQFFDIRGVLTGLTGFLAALLVILFVGVFGAAEPGLYRAGLIHLVPPAQRGRAGEAVDTLAFNLRWWLVGQIVLMAAMGLTTTAGLWLIGVPFALTLGLLAGLLELIPYVGAWVAAVPAALIALTVGPNQLLMTLALYLALHILEGYVLAPMIQRRAAHLPPALTLVAQVLLGELLGVLGLFVAAPLTLCGVVLLKMLYVEDALGDEGVDVPGEPGNERKQAALADSHA